MPLVSTGGRRDLFSLLLAGLLTAPLLHATPPVPRGRQAAYTEEENASGTAQRYATAMDGFEAILAQSPADAAARKGEASAANQWAANEVSAGHPEQGMLILERALRVVPDEPSLLVSFGLEAMTLHQLPIADQALETARHLSPNDPTPLYAMARLEMEEQRPADAERDLKAYLALRPRDASAYYGLGHAYAMEQKDDDARLAFQHSIRLQPQQTESYYRIGELDVQEHRDDAARTLFAQVLERNPHHAGALTGMGELALHAKQYAQAERFLAEAEQSDPSFLRPHALRGMALARLGRQDEARQELQLGSSSSPTAAPQDTTPASPAPPQP